MLDVKNFPPREIVGRVSMQLVSAVNRGPTVSVIAIIGPGRLGALNHQILAALDPGQTSDC